LLTPKGERTIVHYTSPHQQLWRNKDELHRITHTKAVYFGNLPDVSMAIKTELLRYLKKHNILTVMNLGVKDCRRSKNQLTQLLKYIDILIVNGYEFADLVKAPYEDLHFKENVVKWYMPELDGKLVVVTQGKKGSFGYFEEKVFYEQAPKIEKTVDTTGAGDGYTAGFISEFIKTKDIKAAMEAGSKYAAKILAKIGAN